MMVEVQVLRRDQEENGDNYQVLLDTHLNTNNEENNTLEANALENFQPRT
jgi:hypothetical protein